MRLANTVAVMETTATIALFTIAQTLTMFVVPKTALNICRFTMEPQLFLTARKMRLIAHYHAEMKTSHLAANTLVGTSAITHAKEVLPTVVIYNTMCILVNTTQLMRNNRTI
jgi:hypothetical protein